MPSRKMNRWGNRWKGADVVVLASGPSLTAEDIETVRQWREATGMTWWRTLRASV